MIIAKKTLNVSEPAVAFYQKVKMSVEDILRLGLADLDEPLSRLDTFRNGMDKSAFDSFKALSGLDCETLADALGVSAGLSFSPGQRSKYSRHQSTRND